MSDKTDQIAKLLLQTGSAHHTAFLEVDGYDPDWPLWYAEFLQEHLPTLLGKELTTDELAQLMVELDHRHRMEEPNTSWQIFYAQKLLDE
ncbi:MAG: hypothetical protein ACK2U0_07075 [Candidatus Promineifilaceae bacterium]|jgi:hypothetical protein